MPVRGASAIFSDGKGHISYVKCLHPQNSKAAALNKN